MPIETAGDRAALLADFGESMSWTVGATTHTVTVLADAGTRRIDRLDGPGALERAGAVLVRDEDVPTSAGAGDAVTLRGSAHTVRTIEPDGTGFSVVRLEETVED